MTSPRVSKLLLARRIRLAIAMIRALRSVVSRGVFFPDASRGQTARDAERERRRDLAAWHFKLAGCLCKYRKLTWRAAEN